MAAEQETREEKAGGLFGNKERFLKLIVIVGLAGIALIFLSSLLKPKETAQTGDNLTAPEDALVNAESYREQLTRELGNMVASIEGAGRTKLMLTLDGNGRFLIPKRYLTMAAIRQEVKFIGMGDTIEIWASEKVEESKMSGDEFGEALEDLMTGGTIADI